MTNLTKVIWFFGSLIIAMALFALVHNAKGQMRDPDGFAQKIREEVRARHVKQAKEFLSDLTADMDEYVPIAYSLPSHLEFMKPKDQDTGSKLANAFMGQLSSFMDNYPDHLPKRVRLVRLHACYQPFGRLAWINTRQELDICLPYKPFGTYYNPDSALRDRFFKDLLALK